MTDMNTLSAKQYCLLVTLEYRSTAERYTSFTDDIVLGSDTFQSMPSLDARLPEFTGEFEEEPATVTVHLGSPIASEISERRAQPVVTVYIEEIDPSDATTRTELYKGVVVSFDDNPQGIESVIVLTVASPKALLSGLVLGIIVGEACDHEFGDAICSVDLEALEETRTIASIDGKEVVLNGADPSWPDYFFKGKIYRDGVYIDILQADNLTLTLVETPPSSWAVSNEVVVTPGCQRTITSCRRFTKQANPSNPEFTFRGLGVGMPPVSPILGSLSTE